MLRLLLRSLIKSVSAALLFQKTCNSIGKDLTDDRANTRKNYEKEV